MQQKKKNTQYKSQILVNIFNNITKSVRFLKVRQSQLVQTEFKGFGQQYEMCN